MKSILARFSRAPQELLDYEQVRKSLKLRASSEKGLQDIPLEAIVGSVNRYTDFTRDFLPRGNVEEQRWAKVKVATATPTGLDPIEVYKVGAVYFVKDGNHRVSVARHLGQQFIQAYVTEIQTRVPIDVDTRPEDLILKAEYADFLERTRLDEQRPEADLTLTVPGQYATLEEHISVHRHYMGNEEKREILYEEAAAHWFDTVYQPVAQMIREMGILRDFPDRSEADLYLWIAEHRAELANELGMEVRPEDAASDLTQQQASRREGFAARVKERLTEVLVPKVFRSAPSSSRRQLDTPAAPYSLFTDILLPLDGLETDWQAFEAAVLVARREAARLHGLFVIPCEDESSRQAGEALREEFNRRCQAAGVPGTYAGTCGDISESITGRSRFFDLVALKLNHPPVAQPWAAISHGFRAILQRSPRPILAVPELSPMDSAMLAYDGSPKADEALFVSTYLAGQWNLPLVVATIQERDRDPSQILASARRYLESYGIEEATYIAREGPQASTLIEIASEQGCNLLILGGYNRPPVIDVVRGSTVDALLRECRFPLLICR